MDTENLDAIKQQLQDTQAILNGLYEELPLVGDPEQKVILKIKIGRYQTKIEELKKRLTRSFGLEMPNKNSILLNAAQQLAIRKRLPELYLVNCDRQKVYDYFWDQYDEHMERKNPFQFYFMLACPTQQPDSFAERMIYELRKEELPEDPDAILFKRRSDGKRVAFDELPLGRNLRNTKKAFKSYFSERFALNKANASFEDYLKTGLPALDVDFVTMTFDIQISDWNERVMKDYFQWLINAFEDTATKANMPTFWFMFVIFIRNLHEENISKRHEIVLNEVKSIVKDNAEKCTLITEIKPVEVELLEDWLLKVDEENSAGKIEELINTFVNCLPEEKRKKYKSTECIDMTDIEMLQEVIYKLSNSTK